MTFVTQPVTKLGNHVIPMGCVLILTAEELNYSLVILWILDGTIGEASFGDLFDSTNIRFEF